MWNDRKAKGIILIQLSSFFLPSLAVLQSRKILIITVKGKIDFISMASSFLQWFQPWLHIEITWGIFKYTKVSACSQIFYFIGLPIILKAQQFEFLKLPGDCNVQPRLRATGRQNCGTKPKVQGHSSRPPQLSLHYNFKLSSFACLCFISWEPVCCFFFF